MSDTARRAAPKRVIGGRTESERHDARVKLLLKSSNSKKIDALRAELRKLDEKRLALDIEISRKRSALSGMSTFVDSKELDQVLGRR